MLQDSVDTKPHATRTQLRLLDEDMAEHEIDMITSRRMVLVGAKPEGKIYIVKR